MIEHKAAEDPNEIDAEMIGYFAARRDEYDDLYLARIHRTSWPEGLDDLVGRRSTPTQGMAKS
jgi:hypothetical protein